MAVIFNCQDNIWKNNHWNAVQNLAQEHFRWSWTHLTANYLVFVFLQISQRTLVVVPRAHFASCQIIFNSVYFYHLVYLSSPNRFASKIRCAMFLQFYLTRGIILQTWAAEFCMFSHFITIFYVAIV